MSKTGGDSMTKSILTGLGRIGDLGASLACLSLESDRSLDFDLPLLCLSLRVGRLMWSMLSKAEWEVFAALLLACGM